MLTKLPKLTFALLGLTALTGLSSCASNSNKNDLDKTLINNQWDVIRIGNKITLESPRPTIYFEQETMHGNTGCNDFFARFQTRENAIALAPIASQRKACGNIIMDQEHRMLANLSEVLTIHQRSPDSLKTLVLKKDGIIVLVLGIKN